MDISYEYDVQDVLINSRKARPEPEPNWRSLYEAERERSNWLSAELDRLRRKLQKAEDYLIKLNLDEE